MNGALIPSLDTGSTPVSSTILKTRPVRVSLCLGTHRQAMTTCSAVRVSAGKVGLIFLAVATVMGGLPWVHLDVSILSDPRLSYGGN
jgi:hypothetical protein